TNMKILRRANVNGSSAFLIVVPLVAATLYWVAARAQGQPPAQPQTPQVRVEPWNNTGIMAFMRRGAPRGGPPPDAGGRQGAGAARTGGPARGGAFAMPPELANIAGPDGPAPPRDLAGIWDA